MNKQMFSMRALGTLMLAMTLFCVPSMARAEVFQGDPVPMEPPAPNTDYTEVPQVSAATGETVTTTTTTTTAAPVPASESSSSGVDSYKLYVKLGGGYNHTNRSDYTTRAAVFTDSAGGTGAVGVQLNEHFRAEGEFAYRTNQVYYLKNGNGTYASAANGDISSAALMANGYYDFTTDSSLKPYIGAGIGMAQVDAEYKNFGAVLESASEMLFAYQGIVGTNYEISDDFGLFLEYKYFATSDIEIGAAGAEGNYDNHSVFAGIKINFD